MHRDRGDCIIESGIGVEFIDGSRQPLSAWYPDEPIHDGNPPLCTWSYAGDGPNRTAFQILNHASGDAGLAYRLRIKFVRERLVRLQDDEWVMDIAAVRDWIAKYTKPTRPVREWAHCPWHWLLHISGPRRLDQWDGSQWHALGSPEQAVAAGWSYEQPAVSDAARRYPKLVLQRPQP
jgi:hypothetical protein